MAFTIGVKWSKTKKMKKKENEKGKEGMYVSKGVVKKILLAKKEPLYLLPTNMLESFQGHFLEEIPCGLPPIKGIEHQIDFTTSYLA
ncbi:hypothetical protein CR513_25256, partial [Mucuna pruriens]